VLVALLFPCPPIIASERVVLSLNQAVKKINDLVTDKRCPPPPLPRRRRPAAQSSARANERGAQRAARDGGGGRFDPESAEGSDALSMEELQKGLRLGLKTKAFVRSPPSRQPCAARRGACVPLTPQLRMRLQVLLMMNLARVKTVKRGGAIVYGIVA